MRMSLQLILAPCYLKEVFFYSLQVKEDLLRFVMFLLCHKETGRAAWLGVETCSSLWMAPTLLQDPSGASLVLYVNSRLWLNISFYLVLLVIVLLNIRN